MKDYRIFRLDSLGRISSAVEFFCESDEAAMAFAALQENKSGIELWHRAQQLGVIPPSQSLNAA